MNLKRKHVRLGSSIADVGVTKAKRKTGLVFRKCNVYTNKNINKVRTETSSSLFYQFQWTRFTVRLTQHTDTFFRWELNYHYHILSSDHNSFEHN